MAVAAEQTNLSVSPESNEEYAHSLSTIRRLGQSSVQKQPEEANEWLEQMARADFDSAIIEMLKTDQDFRHQIDVDSRRQHHYHDGHVRDADGTPLVQLIETGLLSSYGTAQNKPDLFAQVLRDWSDLDNARKVDQLKPGETLLALSMDPKTELSADKDLWEGLGYREGIAYLQVYTRESDDSLAAGSYSIDLSDRDTWRALLVEQGFDIPEDIADNEWLQHSQVTKMSAEAANQWAQELVAQYYAKQDYAHQRMSVSEYVKQRAALVDGFYGAYYPVLSQAVSTGRNHEALQQLAAGVLSAKIDRLKPEIRTQLIYLANSDKFDDSSARLVNSLIRYAVVEELRKGLHAGNDEKDVTFAQADDYSHYSRGIRFNVMHVQQLVANNIKLGTEANRSYGGCAGQIRLNQNSIDELSRLTEVPGSPQEAFGGKGETDSPESENIPSVIRCIKCDKKSSKSEVVNKDSWRCPHCKYEVDICTGSEKHASVSFQENKIDWLGQLASASKKLAKNEKQSPEKAVKLQHPESALAA